MHDVEEGCDPCGVVGWMVFPGVWRPRAMRWVCSAYLGFAAPQRGAEENDLGSCEDRNAFEQLKGPVSAYLKNVHPMDVEGYGYEGIFCGTPYR